ncbi:cell division protein ZapA [Devosia rhodophyticola]|uniref:Cell division protein ZapA n=1 Tax=Devosia rhodophyticola TaxID=3026423 RepID=A0ABY7YUD1_9HYPH|nr:cell division protein ZapA [Devosia rhodophyticola]WDR04916.1 cell division protein ZapA [Devosia rhodophyticola]
MPEVNVEINGRKYRMACEEGQQEHLLGLAQRFDVQVEGLKEAIGEIGDNRLTVMAGIAVLDELVEAEHQISALKAQVSELGRDGQKMRDKTTALEQKLANKLGDAAQKLEAVANAIDASAPATQN